MKWIFALCLSTAPLVAETCPAVVDQSARQDELLAQLRVAQTPAAAQSLNGQLWEIWLMAPDAQSQAMLDEGMRRRAGFDLLGSIEVLTRLINYCPDYAEGYNQRAFALYIGQDFSSALADLDQTLRIEPNHIGAMSGKALTLFGLGRNSEGQAVLRDAVRLHPWLSERALLDPPLGQEL